MHAYLVALQFARLTPGFSWYVNSGKSSEVLYILALWEVKAIQEVVESSCKSEYSYLSYVIMCFGLVFCLGCHLKINGKSCSYLFLLVTLTQYLLAESAKQC